MTTQPATIKLFLPFGDPTRLRTAELSNWSGKALGAPRSDLAELYEREEAEQSGVYILSGTDPKTGATTAYIGEAEVLKKRLKQHAAKEWSQVVLFISKDDNLTKAHIRYLEGALIAEASDVGRSKVLNAQGSGSKLPESDRSDMDVYLTKVRQLLPVLGSSLLTPVRSSAPATSVDTFSTSIGSLTATGQPTSTGFVVFAGSGAVLDMRPSASPYVVAERERLVQAGRLTPTETKHVFSEDVEFSSPSLAASIIKGGNTNGLTNWKRPDGLSLKDLEKQSSENA